MEFGAPSQQVLSEGDRLIKDLVQKQSYSNIELQSQLGQCKQFERPNELVTITEYTSGQVDCAAFKKCVEFVADLEELRSHGLTTDEIELYSQFHRNGAEFICDKRKYVCERVLREELDCIAQKIADAKTRRDHIQKCTPPVSRHLQELALSVKPESLETKLYSFALSCSAQTSDHSQLLDDPINRLPELEKQLFAAPRVGVPQLKKRRKRAQKYLDKAPASDEPNFDYESGKKSKWDVMEPSLPVAIVKKVYSCAGPANYYTIRDNKIVRLPDQPVKK